MLWSGGPDRIGSVEVSQGHNSVLHRRSDGRLFLTYHTRFIEREGEDYETHIRELLPTEDGWLVAAPYEYQGQVAIPPRTATVAGAGCVAGTTPSASPPHGPSPLPSPPVPRRRRNRRTWPEPRLRRIWRATTSWYDTTPHTFYNGERDADGGSSASTGRRRSRCSRTAG